MNESDLSKRSARPGAGYLPVRVGEFRRAGPGGRDRRLAGMARSHAKRHLSGDWLDMDVA